MLYGNQIIRAVSSMTNQNKAGAFLQDWLYTGMREKISLNRVMSATPTKVCKRGRKPKIDIVKEQQLQILWSKLYFWRRKSVIWKSIFAVGQRRKYRADFSWVLRLIGFPLTREAGQDADFLASYCSTDDIAGKSSAQLKVLILYRNGHCSENRSRDEISNHQLKNWKMACEQHP